MPILVEWLFFVLSLWSFNVEWQNNKKECKLFINWKKIEKSMVNLMSLKITYFKYIYLYRLFSVKYLTI
jgi:hypothetical protein